ncbi:MAG: ankyrin repeat domain-containing protein [Arenimonas sp.]|nr:ankyrin repeat domain-containing protein [Arenimonas sp.]
MVEFLSLALKLALFHGLMLELLKAGARRTPWRLSTALKSAAAAALLWLLLQGVIALLLVWPIQAVEDTRSLPAVLALSAAIGLAVLGLQRLWPNWAQLEQDFRQGWPNLDAAAFGFWRSTLAAAALFLLAAPALLVSAGWAFWPTGTSLWLIVYGVLAVILHAVAIMLEMPHKQEPVALPAAEGMTEAQDSLDPDVALIQAVLNGQVQTALNALEAGANPHQLPASGAKDQRSLMMIASTLSDLRLLRALISKGVDVNAFYAGLNPLLAATRDSWHGRSEAVTMLLTNGANTQVADAEGNTPLHHAMRSTDAAVAALLLDAGADKEAVNRESFTPLALACQAANWRVARYMLERKAKIEPELAEPVLIAASGAEDDEIGVRLLHKHKARIDVRGRKQRTALMVAAQAGLMEVVSVLLELGAQINAQDETGLSAYMLAAQNGELEVLKKLQESAKLNRSLVDQQGRTALDYALSNGRWAAVACIDPLYPLPEHVGQAQDSAGQDSGLQQLHHALTAGDFGLVERLQQAGIQPGAQELADLTFTFSQTESRAALEWLLRNGGQLSGLDASGKSVYQRLLHTSQNQAGLLHFLLSKNQAITGGGSLAAFLESCLQYDFSRRSDEQLALCLLQQGADPFSGTVTGGSPPIVLAVRLGWQRLCQALLALGVDANAADSAGMAALHFAAQLGRGALLQELIAFGADPEQRAVNGQTPLGLAYMHADPHGIEWLSWSDWRLPGRRLLGADLPGTVLAKDLPALKKLLRLGIAVNEPDQKGCTALIHACGQGQADMVRLLLKHGADAKLPARSGATALWASISQAHTEVLEELLQHGTDANQPVAGYPPLNLACLSGVPEQIALLLECGADSAAVDANGQNALHASAVFLSSDKARLDAVILVDMLIRVGVSADAADIHQQTPLHLLCGAALQKGQALKEGLVLSAIDRLLRELPDIDAVDARGFSALHHCAARGYGQLVDCLLQAGADKHRRDNLGRSASDFAVMGGFSEVANRLQDRPERVDIASLLNKKDQA